MLHIREIQIFFMVCTCLYVIALIERVIWFFLFAIGLPMILIIWGIYALLLYSMAVFSVANIMKPSRRFLKVNIVIFILAIFFFGVLSIDHIIHLWNSGEFIKGVIFDTVGLTILLSTFMAVWGVKVLRSSKNI